MKDEGWGRDVVRCLKSFDDRNIIYVITILGDHLVTRPQFATILEGLKPNQTLQFLSVDALLSRSQTISYS